MLKTLLTPLVARFDLTPRPDVTPKTPKTPGILDEADEFAPEDFARDVLIQLMRTEVEKLREAEDKQAAIESMGEIQKFMSEDKCTKDVFREMDGFIALMSALSTMETESQGPVVEPEEQILADVTRGTRLTFVIASEAMRDHAENAEYFERHVGHQSLTQAAAALISDSRTVHQTLGVLLGLAFDDFSLSDVFLSLKDTPFAKLDKKIGTYESRLGVIWHPCVIRAIWEYLPQLDKPMRFTVLKLLELSSNKHRNRAVLSGLGLVKPLFDKYYGTKGKTDERRLTQKLLRRLLEMGATTDQTAVIFKKAIKSNETLDADVLEIIRAGMKSKWPDHFSLEPGASVLYNTPNVKGLPNTGFTFMAWVWLEKLPTDANCTLFGFRISSRWFVKISIRPDGRIEFQSSSRPEPVTQSNSTVRKSRWTHITLVHYPPKTGSPTVRLFVDGVLTDKLDWVYPKQDSVAQMGTYVIGDDEDNSKLSWCIAASYFVATPIGDDIPRVVHHLGPRYTSQFQTRDIVRFLTYEASTSLNIFLSATVAQNPTQYYAAMQVVKDGLGINEPSFVFALNPTGFEIVRPKSEMTSWGGSASNDNSPKDEPGFVTNGNVLVVESNRLDTAMWKLGGSAIALRLVQLASNPHEVSRSLGILTDGLRNSWLNSEDMERLRGYEILAELLRAKSQLINMTGFETLFEFLGMNFSSLEQSTITNAVAYRALALDFELWSHTKDEIQRVHFEHFRTLLVVSKHKRFNAKQRFAKMGVVRKLLFVIQTDWYRDEMLPFLIEALEVTAEAEFTPDEAIKPMIAYLAANIHEAPAASPGSVISHIDYPHCKDKAERILEMLTHLVSSPSTYNKFAAALPLTRICLLLLGDRPSPFVAMHVLILIDISLNASTSFIRKFELVSGWSALKSALPYAWDPHVHRAAFDVLLGRTNGNKTAGDEPVVVCAQILPAILACLNKGLKTIGNLAMSHSGLSETNPSSAELTMEALVEEMINLHSSCPSFRLVFKSQQTTQQFIDAYKYFVNWMSSVPYFTARVTRFIEKLSHLALTLSLDETVAPTQKREILDIVQSAESLLSPDKSQAADIDPNIIVGRRGLSRRWVSSRLSLQVGEKVLLKSMARIHEWRRAIIISEKKRLRKTLLDIRENRRQISRLNHWLVQLTSERAIWSISDAPTTWRLDETEGPYRIRKKLELDNSQFLTNLRVDGQVRAPPIQDVEAEAQSAVIQHEVPPWAESYEIATTDVDGQLAEEIAEDKHRRVRHELEPGDVIEAVSTVARVSGIDSSPGLLIFGKTHLYMLDGLVEKEDGEVIDAHDAPQSLFFVPGSSVELGLPQRAHRWSYEQVTGSSDRTFLFRDVALELYFKDSRSLLVVFLNKAKRQNMTQRLSAILAIRSTQDSVTPGLLKTPLFGSRASTSARVLLGGRSDDLSTAQRRWQTREISNFTYLSIINQISGRTPSDATQYPVFPWVIQDYTSTTLDLSSPETYRDLSCPMGALSPARREAAKERYTSLESVREIPFHYGTHFSSSMIVCHFLIRLAPFTNMFKTLQGGDWDLPDRLFSDIQRAYDSGSSDIRGDVRELIPEFFTCPEFLENSANHDFGVQQNNGEKINHVKLPPWAKEDPLLFIVMNRKALESDYVSQHLPAWIDLIWGCKQRDPDALNVFHPLSYEGSIDLDSITDELEREATVGIIHNFGQTPRRLFNVPHPSRYMHGLPTLPLGTLHGIEEDFHVLAQSDRVTKDLGPENPIRELVVDLIGEKIVPCTEGVLAVPSRPHERVEWCATRLGKNPNGDIRVMVDRKVSQTIESAYCTCAAFADADTLVTGSSDYLLRLWRVSRAPYSRDTPLTLTLSYVMRGHTDEVVAVTASKAWSVAVSGSRDGSAILWDLNKGIYVRSIWHGVGERVEAVAVNESTGYIATCSKAKLCLHTINARPIATLDLTVPTSPSTPLAPITSLAFHERDYSPLGVLATGGADGTITLWTWNADGTPEGEKAVWEFVTMRRITVKGAAAAEGAGVGEQGEEGRGPAITALKFVGESLYHGEDTGKVYAWNLPD